MKQRALARRPKAFPFKMGNANLARTWERNTTSLDGFEPDVAYVHHKFPSATTLPPP